MRRSLTLSRLFGARPVLYSASSATVSAACLPSTLSAEQFRAALSTPHGLFFALLAPERQDESVATLLEQIAHGYRLIPPDTDRKLALRAALHYAGIEASFGGALAIGALVNDAVYLLGVGAVRAFHVDESGRLLSLRLVSATQQTFARGDALVVLSGQLGMVFDPYELALAIYAHDAEGGARRLLALAQQRNATGALMVLKPEHRRSALRSLQEMLRPS